MNYTDWSANFAKGYIIDKKKNNVNSDEIKNQLNAMYAKVEKFSVSEANKCISEANNANLKKLKEFSVEEQEKREKLSKKVFNAFNERIVNRCYNVEFFTSDRYPEELFTIHEDTPEAKKHNQEVRECFASKPEDTLTKEEILERKIDYHLKLLSERVEKCEKFCSKPHTDEELVENIDDVLVDVQIGLQIENMKKSTETRDDKLTDPELRAKYDKLQSLYRRYNTMADVISAYDQRLTEISSPFYSVLDIDDPNTARFLMEIHNMTGVYRLLDNNGLTGDLLQLTDERDEHYLTVFAGEKSQELGNSIIGELNSMKTLLSRPGKSNCIIKIEGVDQEFTDVENAKDEIFEHIGAKVTMTNTDTKESLEVTDFSRHYYQGKLIETKQPNYKKVISELPKEPEQPGFLKRLLNKVSFGFFYKETIANYNKEKKEYDEKVTDNKVAELQEKHHKEMQQTQPGFLDSEMRYRERLEQSPMNKAKSHMLDLYGAVREKNDKLVQGKVYKEDTFEQMKKNDVDLSALKPNNVQVDKEIFASMSMITVLAGEFDSKRGKNTSKTIGFEDVAQSNNNFMPRGGWDSYIKDVVDPARKNTELCLKHFDEQIPGVEPPKTGRERLIETYGEGLKKAIERTTTFQMNSPTNAFNVDAVAKTLEFAEKIGIMDDLKKNGLTDEKLEQFKVSQKCGEIIKDRYYSEMKLMQNNFGDLKLNSKEKRELIDKVVLGRTLTAVTAGEADKANLDIQQKLMELGDKKKLQGETEDAYKHRMAENTQKAIELQGDFVGTLNLQTPVVKDLLNGGSQLKEISERVVSSQARDELAKKDSYEIGTQISDKKIKEKYAEPLFQPRLDKALETIQDPKTPEADLQKAVATLLTGRIFVESNKVSKSDMADFDKSVNDLVSNGRFIKEIGKADQIRANYANKAASISSSKMLMKKLGNVEQTANKEPQKKTVEATKQVTTDPLVKTDRKDGPKLT